MHRGRPSQQAVAVAAIETEPVITAGIRAVGAGHSRDIAAAREVAATAVEVHAGEATDTVPLVHVVTGAKS